MHSTTTVSRSGAMTAISAMTAGIAALTLAACGPREASDTTAFAGGAAPAPTSTTLPPPEVASTDVSAPREGTPVPPVAPVATAPAPAPTSAPTAYAPPSVTVAPAGDRYAPSPTYAAAPQTTPVSQSRPVDRSRIGSVESIEPIRERPQGTGAVIGGVLGAVVGNQFGHGLGRAAMTGLGAAGGAVAGNNVERNRHEGVIGYRVSVRLDNGATRRFERGDVAGLQVGDRVHIDASSFHRG